MRSTDAVSPSPRPARPSALALISALALLAPGAAGASETAKDRYEFDEFCLAMVEAAPALPTGFAKERAGAVTMKPLFAKRIARSGKAIGDGPIMTAKAVETDRRAEMADLQSADPTKAKAAQIELAHNVQRCEALPMFELLNQKRQPARR